MLSPAWPWSKELAEHLHPSHDRGRGLRTDPDNLHVLADLDRALLDPPGRHRPPPGDGEHILHRHQERPIHHPLRLRHIGIHRIHQLKDLGRPRRIALQRLQRRQPHDRGVITRELILGQQLPHLELNQLQELLVIDHIDLVQGDHDVGHPNLTSQQHMLTGLGHRPIRGRHDQDRPIDLGRPGDHVLDVVSMPRHIHMGVMPVRGLILHMSDRDRDPPLLLLRRLINLVKRRIRHLRVPLVQHLGNRRRQGRLPMINMTHRPNVQMRLRPLKLLLRHREPVSSCDRSAKLQGESQPPKRPSPSPGSGGWTRTTDTAIMSRLLYL